MSIQFSLKPSVVVFGNIINHCSSKLSVAWTC